jgi:hypothetical protein
MGEVGCVVAKIKIYKAIILLYYMILSSTDSANSGRGGLFVTKIRLG